MSRVGAGPEDAFYRAFGQAVRTTREREGLSQQELGRRIGLSRASVANIEAGRQRPALHLAIGISAALGRELAGMLQDLPPPIHGEAESEVSDGLGSDVPPQHRQLLAQVLATARSRRVG